MKKTASNLFIGSSSRDIAALSVGSGPPIAVYPIVILSAASNTEGKQAAIKRLVQAAELAYGYRDYAAINQLSDALISIPEGQDAGLFYRAILLNREGKTEEARQIIEPLARYASPVVRIRAAQALAMAHYRAGDVSHAARLYPGVARQAYGQDAFTFFNALHESSIISSESGDHSGALEWLELLLPLIRVITQAHPHLFYLWHNDLAFELAQVGRFDEASKHSAIACSSRLVSAYPEWRETKREIEERKRDCERQPCLIVIRKPESEQKPARAFKPSILRTDFERTSKVINRCGSLYLACVPSSILDRIKVCMRTRDRPCL